MTSIDQETAPPPPLAVIGCGHWGRNLARNFHHLGALAAVSDIDAGRAATLASQYAVPARTADAVLADDGIGAVALATPAATHGRIALQALAAGKHVFVEKPLALTLAEAERVAARAEAGDRVVMVGHLLRYHPAFVALKQLVTNGELGRLRYLYSNRLNLGKFRREEDVFWSFAPHDISMILSLADEMPESVRAVGHCYLHKHLVDVTTTHMTFPSGVNAHIFVSWLHPFKEHKMVVVGSRGMAVFDDGQPWPRKLLTYAHAITWRAGQPEPERAEAVPIALDEAEPLMLECAHFLDCIRLRARPQTDSGEGLQVLRVLEAAQRSMTTDRSVSMTRAAPEPYFAHASAVIDEGCEIGPGTRIWHFAHLLTGSTVGRDCVIGQNVMIGPAVRVGNHCKIQNNVSLFKGVTLEDGVFCGPSCVFTNVRNPRAEIDRRNEVLPTLVGRGTTIGANATIICGTTLGEYCFIAAGAVVTRDVAAHALVAGNPARQIGWVSHAGERLEPDLVCPRTGRRYELAEPGRLVECPSVGKVA